MSVIKVIVLVSSCLLSPAAGMHLQTQRGQQPDLTALDPATCFEAVIVEPRRIKSMSTALLSAVNAKNAHFDLFTIAHGQLNGDYAGGMVQNDTTLRSLKKRGKLRFLSLPFEDLGADKTAKDPRFAHLTGTVADADLEHHDQYSRVLKSQQFWKGFACDRILLLQSDTTLCSNANFGLDHFSMYEYIGGHNSKARQRDYLPGRMHLNGGFSFRNRLGMLRCIEAVNSMTPKMRRAFVGLAEDAFFSNCKELEQPTDLRCKEFAIDAGRYKMVEDFVPFGVHKPWQESGCNECKEANMRICGGAVNLLRDYDPKMAERMGYGADER